MLLCRAEFAAGPGWGDRQAMWWKMIGLAGVVAMASACGAGTQDVRQDSVSRATRAKVSGTRASASNPWVRAMANRCEEYLPLLADAAEDNDLDRGLLVGIVRVESSFRPEAVSSVGAQGLMQVMPYNGRKLKCGDLTDPESNIACGVRVLKGFLRYYKGDIVYALSGYNAGFAQPNLARREGRLPKNRSYVEKVLAARATYLRHGCGS